MSDNEPRAELRLRTMGYSHTQRVPRDVMVIATAAGVAIGLTPPGFLMRLVALGFLGATVFCFRSLTVEVDDKQLRLQFGDGPIKKSFELRDISSARAVRTTPLQGWGIHWVGGGWLYNIYGRDAVELSLTDGKRVLVGTDEPDRLLAVINTRLLQIM